MSRVRYNFLVFIFVAIFGCNSLAIENQSESPSHKINSTTNQSDNDYGEFQVIQSNVLHISSPAYKLQRKSLFKRELTEEKTESSTLISASSTELQSDNVAEEERANQQGRHGDKKKKKKKKKGGFGGLMHKMKKWLPKLGKHIHGPGMFMMGMAQANFNNFVMHALMMSKMALISVIMMILREAVFGDKDQPVRYYNFGYDHHPPRRHYHYDPPPPPPPPASDDYPYDYKRRRRRSASAKFIHRNLS